MEAQARSISPEALAMMRERLSEFGSNGFDASTCLGLIEALTRTQAALEALVDRLDEIAADPEFTSVWTFYHIHDMRYRGPNWVEPLEAARALLQGGDAPAPHHSLPVDD
jgi:hypothetical protein